MNPSNTAISSHSPLVNDPLESKVGLSPPDDPFHDHKSALYPQMTPSKDSFSPPDDPLHNHKSAFYPKMTPSKDSFSPPDDSFNS